MQRTAARQRPASQHGLPSAQPTRKIFNCIVDDTALVAGVKKSTRNGIKQWVKNGQIRLFVPLHALDQLSRQKGASTRHGEDVRETLEWLDDATSKFPYLVTLQGAEETYASWAEVEKFAVPRSLFSESDLIEDHDMVALGEDTANKLNVTEDNGKTSVSSVASGSVRSMSPSSQLSINSSVSPVSPPTSPSKPFSSPQKSPAVKSNQGLQSSSNGSVPQKLQPMFNYILWRIHQEVDPVAALESFIFLCNDPVKANLAKGFEVRHKRLEQLREAVAREDRDFKNRLSLFNKEAQNTVQTIDNDENVKKSPPTAPAAMLVQQPNVIDPDAFSRAPPTTKPVLSSPLSPRGSAATPVRGNNRGGHRGGRGRGGFPPVAAPILTRGGFAPPGGRRGGANSAQSGAQIDPNSFERPRGGVSTRGGRKLWVPS